MFIKKVLRGLAYLISRIIYLKNKLVWTYPASPDKIIWVTPKEIKRSTEFTKIMKKRRYYLNGIISGGNWGKCHHKLKKSALFESFDQYFNEAVPLEETKLFKVTKGKAAAKKYKLKYNPIYRQIKEEGFKIPTSLLDEVDPFKVCIASNGDIMFMTGKHRLAIAKTIEDDFPIPAKVSHRHTKWQEYRDSLYKKLKKEKITKEHILDLDHPDLYDLIE